MKLMAKKKLQLEDILQIIPEKYDDDDWRIPPTSVTSKHTKFQGATSSMHGDLMICEVSSFRLPFFLKICQALWLK